MLSSTVAQRSSFSLSRAVFGFGGRVKMFAYDALAVGGVGGDFFWRFAENLLGVYENPAVFEAVADFRK